MAYKPELALKKTETEATPLSRFFRKVSQLFSNHGIQDGKLWGRICEVQKISEQTIHDLIHFKQALELKADPQLFSLVCALVDSIIKEIARMHTLLEKKTGTTVRVKLGTKYVELTEKAHKWIALGHNLEDLNLIKQAVVMQTVLEFQALIDRDAQVIQDYLNHAAEDLPLSQRLKADLKKKLVPTLSPILMKLYALKEVPQELCLDTLMTWRLASDQHRESLFTEALHTIDTFFTH